MPDEVMERIFEEANKKRIPIGWQSIMIDVIENVLKEMEVEINVPESKLF